MTLVIHVSLFLQFFLFGLLDQAKWMIFLTLGTFSLTRRNKLTFYGKKNGDGILWFFNEFFKYNSDPNDLGHLSKIEQLKRAYKRHSDSCKGNSRRSQRIAWHLKQETIILMTCNKGIPSWYNRWRCGFLEVTF